ncbi:LysR family transcriptional regulator [Bordetella ansorpii]|uniref:LysR family transcriptional regulator n=1 Tax=Bordetella ansorpii TaxID=288768 RepID=A0A157RN14_9BORD|nr:LysR family transcriptional regulator [Bordetella ansorpii]SAI59357.1 LysR family transcriptional regulator [Bordetella ansorpii]
MDLVDCRLVVNIARSQSLTHGGRDTFLSLPAASLRLKSLEGELGLRLFHRRHNGMEPTEAGHAFIQHAQTILANVEGLHTHLRGFKDKGRRFLRVAANTSYVTDYLPPLVRDYLAAHPGVGIDVQSARNCDIDASLMEDRIDIGFVSSYTANFCTEPIDFGPDPLVAIVSADSPLAGLDRMDMRRFAACDHVVLGEQSTLTYYLRARLAEDGLKLNVRTTVADYRAILEMVASGIGVGVVHASLLHRYESRKVRAVALDAAWSQHRRYALVAEGARSQHYVNDFLSYVVDHWVSARPGDVTQAAA